MSVSVDSSDEWSVERTGCERRQCKRGGELKGVHWGVGSAEEAMK